MYMFFVTVMSYGVLSFVESGSVGMVAGGACLLVRLALLVVFWFGILLKYATKTLCHLAKKSYVY